MDFTKVEAISFTNLTNFYYRELCIFSRMYERDGDLLDSGECAGLSNLSLGSRDNVQYPQLVIGMLHRL